MQVLERIKKSEIKSAQNLIEFIFVLPTMLFLTLIIFEVGLFWQEVNAIYNLNAEINANVALQNTGNMTLGTRCPAATRAIEILKQRDSMISLNDPTYNDSAAIDDPSIITQGQEPFALYKYTSNGTIAGQFDANGQPKHQVTLWVDCRNPFEDGVTTQIEFYHKTMVMKATIPRFDKPEGIVVIPENIFISSPKLNTLRHY